MMAIGFTIILIGWTFEATPLKSLNLMVPGISSTLIFMGVLIAASPLILNLEFFYRPLANWIVITLISCILIFSGLTIFTNLVLSVISLIIIGISVFVLFLVIVYIIMNMVKRARAQEISSKLKKEELKDTLTIFTRPQTITEEELNTYREQKICVVCKSKVSRLNYVCPKCAVLYCIRCSKALVKLENLCWVCDTSIDISDHIPVLEVEEILKEKDVVSND
ncbi:MAG: hypothetical protein ACFE8G_00910 [Candidatus Hermodarchaeota archaeon]